MKTIMRELCRCRRITIIDIYIEELSAGEFPAQAMVAWPRYVGHAAWFWSVPSFS